MRWARGVVLATVALLFLTSAAVGAPTPGHLHFAAAGDFGASPATTGTVLTGIADSHADLALALGDLSYGQVGGEQAWCDFVTQRVGAGFPFEIVSGNHESNGANGNVNDFTACLPNQLPGVVGTYGRQYYVDVPADDPLVRFVMISPALTYPDGPWSYAAGSPRLAWTGAAIDRARAEGIPWVVVGMHKPCLSVGEYNCEPGSALVDMLLVKKVDLVLSGHEHNYQRTAQLALNVGCPSLVTGSYDARCVRDGDDDLTKGAGTVFLTLGTGGVAERTLHPGDPEAPYFVRTAQDTFGFGDFDVTPDQLTASFQRTAGDPLTDSFTLTKSTQPPTNVAPTAAFTSTANGLTATFDSTGSGDSDGFITGYSWDFGDNSTGTGAAPTHVYANPGTYPVTLSVTDDRGETSSVTHPVTVEAPAGPVVLAEDDFERTVASGWGTADTGGSWTMSGPSSVSGGLGRMSLPKASAQTSGALNSFVTDAVDVQVSFSTDKVPAGSGASLYQSTLLRRTLDGYYRALTRITSAGDVKLSLQRNLSGTDATLVNLSVPGLHYTAGDVLNVRAQATGSAPTTLRVKVWKAGTPEPGEWMLTSTDAAAALQSAGSLALISYLSGASTNAPLQVRYDDFRAVSLAPQAAALR